jgi:hypothetical protein
MPYAITIENIMLSGNNFSNFRMNVDGIPGSQHQNIEIPGDDSIYVFVDAKFPALEIDSVCFREDSVIVSNAKETKVVKLVAWSQDVQIVTGRLSSQTWNANRPYLIKDSVWINPGEVLVINEGVQVFFHKDAFMGVAGSLVVKGSQKSPVVFQGDRFDKMVDGSTFRETPGQWVGILFLPGSKNNLLQYAEVKNGINGVWAGSLGTEEKEWPQITIQNCMIRNHSSSGLVAFGAKINCWNTIFTNNNCCIALYCNGEYHFNHVTVNNQFNYRLARKASSIFLSNVYEWEGKRYLGEFQQITFLNSIVHGNQENEFYFQNNGKLDVFHCSLENCLVKSSSIRDIAQWADTSKILWNVDPRLVAKRLTIAAEPDSISPVVNKGSRTLPEYLKFDYFGIDRTRDGFPDLGAIERME